MVGGCIGRDEIEVPRKRTNSSACVLGGVRDREIEEVEKANIGRGVEEKGGELTCPTQQP